MFRFRILGLLAILAAITYLDRVCFGSVARFVQDEFDLSATGKGMLFSAFALAYSVFEVPTGWLGDRFGPRSTLLRIVLWWSFFTALTGLIWPVAGWPWLGFLAMLAVRFLFGAGEAGAFPNIARALQNWFPLRERGMAQGTIWMAGRLGGGLTPFVVTLLLILLTPADAPTANWRPIFWIFGGLGVVWCFAFLRIFRDQPAEHPAVSAAERQEIELLKPVETGHRDVPWRSLLLSGNLWALCLMYFCTSYGWYFNITYLPGYLVERFAIDDKSLGFMFMTGAPLLVGSLACFFGGLLTDGLVRRLGNLKWGRRTAGVLGHGLCAAFYGAALFAGSAELFVFCIAAAAFWNDMTMGSSWAVCQDIGGRFTGVVSGCMNTIGNLGGVLAGVATGMILDSFASGSGAFNSAGWAVALGSYAAVYLVAVMLWLRVDASKPIVEAEPASDAITTD